MGNILGFVNLERDGRMKELCFHMFMCTFQLYHTVASISDTLTSALLPVKPFADPPTEGPTFEVEEFFPEKASLCTTFDYFLNHLYVYPLSLKYDSQKAFAKVRV